MLEHCHVTNGHARPVFGRTFLIFVRKLSEPHSYRNYQTHRYLLEQQFGPKFLKKMAYNAFFAVSVRIAIFGLFACFRACYQLSTWADKNGPMSHVSAPVRRLSNTIF